MARAEDKDRQVITATGSTGLAARPGLEVDFLGISSLLIAGLLILLSGLVFALPPESMILGDDSLALVIESLCAAIGLAVFYVGFARFVSGGRRSDLFIGLAFFAFSASSLVYGIILPLIDMNLSHIDEMKLYGALLTRLIGGVLLVLGFFLANSIVPRKKRVYRGMIAVAWLTEAGLGVGFLLFLFRDRLPPLTPARSGTAIGSLDAPHLTLQLAIVLVFLAGAFAYYLAYRRSQDTVTGCLSLGLIVASFSELHLMSYPTLYGQAVTSGDLVRLLFYLVLWVGLSIDYMQSFVRLQSQHLELAALYRMATVPVSTRDLPRALADVCSTIRVTLQVEQAIALLHDAEADEFVVYTSESAETGHQRIPLVQAELAGNVLRTGAAAVSSGDTPNGWLSKALQLTTIRQALLVPLRVEGRGIGVLVAANHLEEGFGPEEERLLTVMALRSAMVIENTRLYDHVEAAAALEERTRLAREVHDGLAQNLSYLNLKLARLQGRGGLPEEEHQQLGDIKRICEAALTEARDTIAALRTDLPGGENLVDTLRRYAEDFGEEHGLEVGLVGQNGIPTLTPMARVELLRIMQEALSNVRKHAAASRVEISLAPSGQGLTMRVQDDGQGFKVDDLAIGGQGHYGLVGMRERAQRLGGELRVQSQPGAGTVVEVEIPEQARVARPVSGR